MTRAEAVEALLDTWSGEVGDEAAHGVLFGILVARADPVLAEVVERGMDEMLDGERDSALAAQGARERWCAGVKAWLREQEVAA